MITIDEILDDLGKPSSTKHDLSQSDRAMQQDIFLLYYACGNDIELTRKYIQQWKHGRLKILTVYPGCDEDPPHSAEYIGAILDGGLYLIPSKKRKRTFKIYSLSDLKTG